MSATLTSSLDERGSAEVSFAQRWSIPLLYGLAIGGFAIVSSIPVALGIPSRGISIAYRAGFLSLALLVILQNLGHRRIYSGAFWFPFALFWLLYIIRLLSDTVLFPVPVKMTTAEYFLWAIGVCLIPSLAFFRIPDEKTLKRSASVTLLVAAIATLAALYAAYQALATGASMAYENGRLDTATLGPIGLGHLGVSLAIMSVYFLPRWKGALRLLPGALILLGIFTALAAASRGPLFAFAGVGLFQIWVWLRGKSPGRILSVIVLAVFAMFLVVQGAFLIQDRLGFRAAERFESLQNTRADVSAELHIEAPRDAWQQFLDHPLFGNGVDEERSMDYPHNVAIESFMATGIFGGTAFCLILVWSTIAAVRLSRRPAALWVSLLFLQQLIAALVSGALYLSLGMWMFAVAVVALDAAGRMPAYRPKILISSGKVS